MTHTRPVRACGKAHSAPVREGALRALRQRRARPDGVTRMEAGMQCAALWENTVARLFSPVVAFVALLPERDVMHSWVTHKHRARWRTRACCGAPAVPQLTSSILTWAAVQVPDCAQPRERPLS
jgi:hypothetical protein